MKNTNNPTYFQWLFTEHAVTPKGIAKIVLSPILLAVGIYMTPLLLEEYRYSDMPFIILLLAFIAMYGAAIGITLQPYLIYKKLIRIDWFEKRKNFKK
jgi:hypothetical protein|tara:strand:- start:287 stop:580 length:294 start_codon:yes stop_codon:yes gene_type:complete